MANFGNTTCTMSAVARAWTHTCRGTSFPRVLGISLAHQRSKHCVRSFSTPQFPGYDLREAIKLSKAMAWANFEESVELSIETCVDPKKPNQMIRGLAQLPHGTGKSVSVAVFAKDAKAEEAKEAGADIVGAMDLVEKIQAGEINFSRCIATPDMMPFVGRVARILGPKGLMPNPKVGTVTQDVASAVKAAKQGEIQFKCDKWGYVRVPVGKLTFSDEALDDNVTAFIDRLNDMKPSGAKGTLIRNVYLSSTMGRGIKLHPGYHPFKKQKAALATEA